MAGGLRKPLGVRIYNGANWEDYKVEFERFSRTLEEPVWEVVTGALKQPEAPDNYDDAANRERKERDIQAWRKTDAHAIQYISCTVHEDKRPAIRHCETAHDAWTKLESAAAAESGSSVIAGIFRLVNLKQTNYSTMDDYATAVNNQVHLLRNQQVDIPDIVTAALMIHGLSEDYSTQRALLEDKGRDVLTSAYVRTKLLEAEKNLHSNDVPEAAYQVFAAPRRRARFTPRTIPSSTTGGAVDQCSFCGKTNHPVEKCWKKLTEEWTTNFPEAAVPDWAELTRKRRQQSPEQEVLDKRPRANLVFNGMDPISDDEERACFVSEEDAQEQPRSNATIRPETSGEYVPQ
jgi:hypothetical protein